MALSPLVAAKRLCKASDWSVSNLKLQKLLYLAHMFHLGKYDEPLITGNFEAWEYGPVQPEVYQTAKVFGSLPVENIFRSILDAPDGTEVELIDEAFKSLGNSAPGRLVSITHWEQGAWAGNYASGFRGAQISNKEIQEEYEARVLAIEKK
jgi:uncharacterized phage-associated protein